MFEGWRRAVVGALAIVVLGVAVWFSISTWQRIMGNETAISAPSKPTPSTLEQAIASVSEPPPTSTVPSSSVGYSALVPVDSASFQTNAKNGDFDGIVVNSGSHVVAGYIKTSQTEPIVVAQLLPEQADLLVANSEDAGLAVEIVDPVRAWNTSVDINQEVSDTPTPLPYLPVVIGSGVLLLIVGSALLIRNRRKSRKAFGAHVSVSSGPDGDKSRDGAYIPPTRFTDIAGCDEAVEDLKEIVDFLKNPERYQRVNAEVPRGALLIGPPGTGKTLLARAVAGEAGVPFYPVSGSDFVEMYVGVGSSRVRKLFAKARKHKQGAIVFIDEIDAVGRKRGYSKDSHQEQESTLNALLVEMDGFHQDKVIVLGASNRADMLDPALRRPGRLERQVQVPLPDRMGRERILRVHAENRPLEEEVDLAHVARRTPGMSGAELARVVNEACLVAARKHKGSVGRREFEEAIETVALGKARVSAVVTDQDRLITAWHEAGHTVAALKVPFANPPISVSIIPRGPAGGVTWMHQGDEVFLTRTQAHAQLVVAMAGRAAEEILLEGEFTSGPHGDLASATALARNMVTKFGMTKAGLMVHGDEVLSSGGPISAQIVDEVESLLTGALAQAREVLVSNSELLEQIVLALLDRDSLSAPEISTIVSKCSGNHNASL